MDRSHLLITWGLEDSIISNSSFKLFVLGYLIYKHGTHWFIDDDPYHELDSLIGPTFLVFWRCFPRETRQTSSFILSQFWVSNVILSQWLKDNVISVHIVPFNQYETALNCTSTPHTNAKNTSSVLGSRTACQNSLMHTSTCPLSTFTCMYWLQVEVKCLSDTQRFYFKAKVTSLVHSAMTILDDNTKVDKTQTKRRREKKKHIRKDFPCKTQLFLIQ